MSIGPNGEKRPADPVSAAHLVASIAVGDAEEQRVNRSQSKGGKKGARSRANSLTAERRSEIAKAAAKARWAS